MASMFCWIILYSWISSIHYINAQNLINCSIPIGCVNKVVDCPSNADCFIDCAGRHSCSNSILNCPHSANCTVSCWGHQSCQDTMINASRSHALALTLLGPDSAPSDIYCPDIDTHNLLTNYGCDLYGFKDASSPHFSDVNVYVEAGPEDILITCDHTLNDGYTCIQNMTLFWGSDYGQSCITDGAYDSKCLPVEYFYPLFNSTNNTMPSTSKRESSRNGGEIAIYISVAVGAVVMCLCVVLLIIYLHKKAKRIQKELEKVRSESSPVGMEETVKTVSSPDDGQEVIALPEDEPTKFMDEVHKWLTSMDLEKYHDNFVSNGYTNLKFILQIADEDDLEELGITLKGHQKMILGGIASMQEGNGYDIDYKDVTQGDDHEQKMNKDAQYTMYTNDSDVHIQPQTASAPGDSGYNAMEGNVMTGSGEKTPRSSGMIMRRRMTPDHEDMYGVDDAMMDGDKTQTGNKSPVAKTALGMNMSISSRAAEVLDETLVEVLRIPSTVIEQNEQLKLDD